MDGAAKNVEELENVCLVDDALLDQGLVFFWKHRPNLQISLKISMRNEFNKNDLRKRHRSGDFDGGLEVAPKGRFKGEPESLRDPYRKNKKRYMNLKYKY